MIRRAENRDIPRLHELLSQVLEVHAEGRPDIFIPGTRKYTDGELEEILKDDSRPVFVSTDETDTALAYAFCVLQRTEGANNLRDMTTLYIDDLCVDSACRGRHIASELFAYVKDYAASLGCYHLTLNVWELNEGARKFYEAMGMKPLKTTMETIL